MMRVKRGKAGCDGRRLKLRFAVDETRSRKGRVGIYVIFERLELIPRSHGS
jgi:hypothetical protein